MNKPSLMARYHQGDRSFAAAAPDLCRLAVATLRRRHAVATRAVALAGAPS